jgi:hypothetical protein
MGKDHIFRNPQDFDVVSVDEPIILVLPDSEERAGRRSWTGPIGNSPDLLAMFDIAADDQGFQATTSQAGSSVLEGGNPDGNER